MKSLQSIPNQVKIYLAGAIVLLVAIILILTRKTEIFEATLDGKLPFVLSSQMNATFYNYITTLPVSYVALITGRQESGKSRALNYFSDTQTQLGRLVLNIDLKSVNTYEDLLSVFRISAIEQFNIIKQIISSSNLKKIVDFNYDANLNLPEATPLPDKLKNLYFSLYSQLNHLLDHKFSQRSVFEFGRLLSLNYHALAPIVIIQNYDRIYNITAPNDPEFGIKLADAIESYLSARSHLNHKIPVFFEIKNSLLKIQHRWGNAFRFIEMQDIENAEREYTSHYKIFSPQEIKKIIGAFGTHPGSLSSMFEARKLGINLDVAISNEQTRLKNIVNVESRDNTTVKAFCSAPYQFHPTTEKHISDFYDLIEQGLLYLDNELILQPSNKAVFTAMC
ncbi:hypothetical protein TVAG_284580 [Trichomonas vaginalis G3]|uniref:Uncharacterized protein n=1 Tax=Trichomonas vaginalis (strain ATCC PRA-98 / G3) TaxID=412133 RepID=A2ENB6_TRIV3|nr:hypothetical protein TVAGG3_0356820 [Trichomonas vaginalis G3]EAY05875.1 hypothetical protein TVAG_284580 [Trichomonas vaginalis G3]KAI5531684.1 hypothetical protein TVAGG3_0356820 [Trichomonas vaginalis G3]|eukprot:XP_001318098.1 hypothetical protein [Trichomonas vaginalis G3]